MRKYLLKAATGMIVLAMLFITGCETDNSVTYSDEDRVVGTLHGVVTDAADNARMLDVTVTVVQKGSIFTTETDELGYYVVKGLYSGDYEATYVIDGYAVSRAYGYIPTLEEVTNAKTDLNHSEVLDMDLFRLNAGLSGKMYKAIDNGVVMPASGITVIADFDHFDISPNEYTAVTDANGMYSFANIPAAPMVAVRTLPFNDGTYSFDPTYTEVGLESGISVVAEEIGIFLTEAEPFVLTHNIEDGFAIGEPIVMTFNKAIDTESFKVYLGIDKSAKTEINSVVWSNGNMTVTITPDEELVLDEWYYIYFYGKSVDGNYFEDDYSFRTQPGIEITTTNIQVWDEYNEITTTQEIVVNFSEPVLTTDSDQYFIVDGASATPSWSNGNKTVTINAPVGGYTPGDTFWFYLGVTSNLAEYDYLEAEYRIHVK